MTDVDREMDAQVEAALGGNPNDPSHYSTYDDVAVAGLQEWAKQARKGEFREWEIARKNDPVSAYYCVYLREADKKSKGFKHRRSHSHAGTLAEAISLAIIRYAEHEQERKHD